MVNGLVIILVYLAIAEGQDDYNAPFLPGNYINFDTTGDLLRTFTVRKYSPKVCYLRLNFDGFGDVRYLDCKNEYLSIGEEKICGIFSHDYEFPFMKDNLTLTYRGHFPLKLKLNQIECRPNELGSCDVITKEMEININSPNYPNHYPPLSHCQYTILPANEAICQVSIFFHDIDMESSPNCQKDRLLIDDARLCGNLKNYRINKNIMNNFTIRFISDSSISGRGFTADIRQIHCGNTLLRFQNNNFQTKSIGNCCEREYRDPYMIITSPGFLENKLIVSNCRYAIYQAHPNACRLRFHFKHFWVGEEDIRYGCLNNFFEIDNNRFCGCLDGYQYVSHFDEEGRKDLWYSYRGTGQRGFIIEIQQEECDSERYPFNSGVDPKTEIEVFTTNITSEKALDWFPIPREVSRCYNWGLPGWFRQVEDFLTKSKVPTFCSSSFHEIEQDSHNISEHIPNSQFYPLPEDDSVFIPFYPSREFPIPVPPNFTPSYPNSPAFFGPTMWRSPIHSRCEILNNYFGELRSPFYPARYPPNSRKCYTFQRIPGYCKVEVRFLNFELENSIKCWKDYLLIEREHRFCGKSLTGSNVVLDFRNNGLSYLHFVSDKYFSGRGFFAKYRQLHCLSPYSYEESFQPRFMTKLGLHRRDNVTQKSENINQ